MLLARENKEIPKQWEHDPATQDKTGMTVAMFLTGRTRTIPIRW